jgi:hypothetical protein
MINPASQRQCTSRAEWRLQTGRDAKPLSPHYRLDCDYGTAVIILWKEGGGEPIYVCPDHAKQLGRSREHFPDAHIVTVLSEQSDSPAQCEDRPQPPQVIETKSGNSPSPEAARSFADTKAERTIFEARNRPSVRDTTYGNSAKAMVDEAIWNMATGNYQAYRTALLQGKSPSEAAEAAGGQLAFIHRKINDYTLKLEAIFSTSQGTIDVEKTIDKPLEQAMLDTINNDAMSDLEKDAAMEQLGTLQEWVKQDLQREMTPLQANRILLALGDRLDWGGNSSVSENFKTVCRALYGGLRAALYTAAPESQNLHDRLTNLYAAKSEMQAR